MQISDLYAAFVVYSLLFLLLIAPIMFLVGITNFLSLPEPPKPDARGLCRCKTPRTNLYIRIGSEALGTRARQYTGCEHVNGRPVVHGKTKQATHCNKCGVRMKVSLRPRLKYGEFEMFLVGDTYHCVPNARTFAGFKKMYKEMRTLDIEYPPFFHVNCSWCAGRPTSVVARHSDAASPKEYSCKHYRDRDTGDVFCKWCGVKLAILNIKTVEDFIAESHDINGVSIETLLQRAKDEASTICGVYKNSQ